MLTGRDLLSFGDYCQFRDLARDNEYDGPMVPAIGPEYGAEGMPKLVYCGVATREREFDPIPDAEAYEAAVLKDQRDFEATPANPGSSAFWHMGLAVAQSVGQRFGFSREQAWKRMAWTNLSKLCLGTETGPPPEDRELRKLDVAQVRMEWGRLAPDVFICAAGNYLVCTGHELFGEAPGKTATGNLPTGGKWIWTMHPNARNNPAGWREEMVAKVLDLLD